MKKLPSFFLLIYFTLFTISFTKAQGVIQSLWPATGLLGQQHELIIRSAGSQFVTGAVTVDLGQGISINYIHVNNSFTLRVGIQIAANANIGSRNLKVISSNQVIEYEDAFEVLSVGGTLQAILEIVPAQTIYASDFDPDNPALAPLLFKVTVFNDQVQRNLKVVFSLFLENKGLLGKAIKKLPIVLPNEIKYIDNRNFDTYEFSPESEDVANQVLSTGVLPAGTYTYRIEIFDQKNNLLTTTEATNTLTNQANDLILLSPGGPIDMPPETVPQAQPMFQWISTANQFDLILYKVEPGQTNAQQIMQTLPVFKQLGITGNTLLYPMSAEILEIGKTYAWQLRAYINTASGNLITESPLFWFDYAKPEASNIEIVSFRVVPEQSDVFTGAMAQFNVEVLDALGNKVNVTPTWKVTPSTDGTVNSNGLFNAGNYPKTIAVVAEYGTHKDYAIVNIKFAPIVINEFDLIYQLFGNPNNIKIGKL